MHDSPQGDWTGRLGVRNLLFAVLILFALAPLAVSNLWGHRETRRVLTTSAFRNASNVAALEAARTDEFIRDRQIRLQEIGSDLVQPGQLGAEITPALLRGVGDDPAGSSVLIVQTDGARSAASVGSSDPPELCREAARAGHSTVGFVYGGPEPTLVVAEPLKSGDGVVCGSFPFSVHHEFVADSDERMVGARISLLDGAGDVLCGSTPESAEAGAEDHAAEGEHGAEHDPIDLDGVRVVPDGTSWVARKRAADDSLVIAAMAPLSAIPGGVLAEVPMAAALDPLTRLTRRAIALSALLGLLLVVVVRAVSLRLTRPLLHLAGAAENLAGARLDARVVPSGPRELRLVAEGFNSMASRLQESHSLLEQRIVERTAELERSRAFVELLFDSIDHEVRVFGPDGLVLRTNSYARDAEPGIGSPCHARCGSDGTCDTCPLTEVFATGRHSVTERSQARGEYTEIVRAELWPVEDGGGGVSAVVEISRVVTDEKQMTAQLLHQEKMAALGLVTAGVAHEIGNPLSGVLAEARRGRGVEDSSELRTILATVEEQAQRMSRLLRELVDFGRRRRDLAALVSLNQVCEDVVRLLGHDPRSRGVVLETVLDPALPPVRAKEDQLVQVLLNLGLNALDSVQGAEERRLVFETSAQDGAVLAKVTDSGPGVPRSQRARIFEPFWTSKGAEHGTGLGLFLSRDVVESLGGRLEITSGEPGDCVFLVVMPSADGTGGEP